MSACFDDHMLPCLHVLTITWPHSFVPSCSYLWTLWCSHAHMHVCSYAHMLLLAWLVTCTRKLIFSHAHSWMLTFLIAHMLECSHTTCFDDDMLPSSRALLIKCYYATCFDNNMLPCTHTLIFMCLISTNMCTHLVDYLSLYLEA